MIPIEEDETTIKVTPANQKRQIYQPFISSFLGDPEILSERIPTSTQLTMSEEKTKEEQDFR
jgi:hypothetical protein